MKNVKSNSTPSFKLYGFNVPSKYISEKYINLSDLAITEKEPKKKMGRNHINYKKNEEQGRTEDLSERNKSALVTKYRNMYSMIYYNNQLKSIEKNMGIENNNKNKTKNEKLQLNYLNIKKINLPLNHIKINFDTINKFSLKENKNNINNKTYLKLNKDKICISTFNSQSKRNKINMKNSPKIFNQYSLKDFSSFQFDKNRLQKISESINLPSVSMMMKKRKININTNYFCNILSIIPKKSIIKRLHKINTFSQPIKNKTCEQVIINQKINYNNIYNSQHNNDDINKYIVIKNHINENIKEPQNKTRKHIFKRNIIPKNILDLPPMNYYKDNFYYYNIFPSNCGWLIKDCFSHRLKWRKCHSNNTNLYNFKWKEVIINNDEFKDLGSKKTQMINHFEFHSSLSNKCNMFYNFAKYCEEINIDIFQYVPFTIILDIMNFSLFYSHRKNFKEIFDNIEKYLFDSKSISDKIYDRRKIPYKDLFPMINPKFGLKLYCEISKSHYDGKNLWVIKAPNLNRGRGVKIFNNYNEIITYIKKIAEGKITESELYDFKEKNDSNYETTKMNEFELKDDKDYIYQSSKIIIQKYIEKPFLYQGRKCDIRIWVLITHTMKVYIFKEGHLKASSVNYNKDDFDSFIHITNYSLQKYNKSFSKYEKGNEISFQTFQNYINENDEFDFRKEIFPKFIEIVRLTTLSVRNKINMNNLNYCFEIFGYDFMMDEDKNIYLIEINTNPGLEISSDIIAELVPRMIDDALLLTVDELFPTEYSKESLNENGQYKSKFHVNGYKDEENMWEFVCDMKKNNDKELMNSFKSPLKRKKIKIKKTKK